MCLATTTSLVTGLVCLELYKVIDGKNNLDDYKNAFINLALPFIGFGEPVASPKGKYLSPTGEVEFDKIWDRFYFDYEITLQELLDEMKKKGLVCSMVSCGVSLLYGSFFPQKKLQDRLHLKYTAPPPPFPPSITFQKVLLTVAPPPLQG